ncbi:hypothetical protein MtrunA17_Chr3g0112871 [Medicago truncatula]|uniref:Transmembrane protein, putative n=1 Tax=Medicago truncatula TaxID=3880 RepID=A0A072UY89_MEDTR|nr:transmembrane protein, putative [Medicago truncatula]RHN68342.1 hypothetical protein MtrunA17_Chr3g0112871 [Medicago truncatula]
MSPWSDRRKTLERTTENFEILLYPSFSVQTGNWMMLLFVSGLAFSYLIRHRFTCLSCLI